MFSELMQASQSVQALGTLLKAANGLANYNEIVAQVSEVNGKLMAANAVALAAQEKQATLTEKIHALEQEINSLKDWQAEVQNYEEREVSSGVFVQIKKGITGPLESAHKLCTNCFYQRKKALLQQQNIQAGRLINLVCHRCDKELRFSHYSE